MSILIKGLKMPKEYEFIDLVITGDGVVREYYEGKVDIEIAEAVELPDHGDLVDRDALARELGINDFDCEKCGWYKDTPFPYCSAELDDACFSLENAEVIIPADRKSDLCDACGKADKENCSYCEKMERSKEDENWYTELDDPKIAERSEE